MRFLSPIGPDEVEAMVARTNALCEGCYMPPEDVGPTALYRVTFSNGTAQPVRYCDDCAAIARYGVEDPGAPVGAGAAPTHITKLERVTYPETVALASAMPRPMDEASVLREHQDAMERVLAEADGCADLARLWEVF